MRILIIKPSSLGDIVHALPFLKALRDKFPDAHISWVVSKGFEDILSGNPLINELIIFDKNLKGIVNLAKTLKAQHYDMVIDLQGLLRSGLMTFFAKAPLKIGFENAREGSRYFYNKKIKVDNDMHAVDRYLEVVKAIEHRSQMTDKAQRHRGTEAQSTEHREGKIEFPLYIDKTAGGHVKRLLGDIMEYVVIVPSARWQTKRWPPEHFASLISRIQIPCVITGSKGDREIAQRIAELKNPLNILDLCGKLNLKELSALIAGSKVVVSADSGPLHIAVALGVPVVALFGPTDPQRTGPYGWKESRKIKVLRASVLCSPCFKKECKNPICMDKISVETVLKEIREYL